MKHFTLFKPLLMAVALLVGGVNFAWGDIVYNSTLVDQNFSDVSSESANWTTGNNMAVAQTLRSGSNYYYTLSYGGTQNGASWADYKLPSLTAYSAYQISFLWGMYSCSATNRNSLFKIVGASGDLATTGYVAGQSSSLTFTHVATSTSLDINVYNTSNRGNANRTTTLYKIIIEGVNIGEESEKGVWLTITNEDGSVSKLSRTKIADYTTVSSLRFESGQYFGQNAIDDIVVKGYAESETVTNPTIGTPVYAGANRTVSITNGTSSVGNTVHTYYTLDGTDPTALSSEYTEPLTITENCTLKAITISSTGEASSIVSSDIEVGKLTLNAPTINISSFLQDGLVFHPVYTFTSNQSGIEGAPVVTYSYSFNGGASTEGTSYTALTSGSLTVTVSATNYNSNSTVLSIEGGNYAKTYSFDAINDVTVDTSTGTWENATLVNSAGWSFTDLTNCTFTIREDITLNTFRYARATTAQTKQGFYTRLGAGSINYTLEDGELIAFTTLNDLVVANSASSSQAFSQHTNVRAIEIYTPATEADIAILDCKQYETSDAFATAVAGESFASASDVYAFHTAWQIAQAKAKSSTDITNVIRNAAIDESGTDWANARILNGQQYTSAPDNYYLDQYQATIDAYQTIYGLPAGSYKIKAATRGSADASGNIYVYAEGQVDTKEAINLDGNTGGALGQGWSWTEVAFKLTSTSDVKIGFYADASASGQWAGCDDWHMEIVGTPLTISSAGWATLYTPYALDFSSLSGSFTAYTASLSESTVTLTEVSNVPANTGVVLKGDAGSYNIPVITSSETAKGDLIGNATEATAYNAVTGYDLYMLALNDASKAQFTKVTGGSIAAGKAFLKVANSGSGSNDVKFFNVVFNDTPTGIRSVDNGPLDPEGRLTPQELTKDNAVFNLAGQRVSQPTRGIYIVNGKKVIVK